MKLKLVLALVVISVMLYGCQPVETSTGPDTEMPAFNGDQQPSVDEEVIVPAHEPEPVPEPEPEPEPVVEQPVSLLEDSQVSEHFLHGRPDVGKIITKVPRKIDIVFNYPIVAATIEVTSEDGAKSHGDGDASLTDTDLLVVILYLNDMEAGIYKVKYDVVLAGKEAKTENGYYYFELQ